MFLNILKKYSLIIFTLLFIYKGSIIVNASDNRVTVLELYDEWMTSGFPDNVGGLYYGDNENYIIPLVNISESYIDEIKLRLSDPDKVEFVEVKYSFNEMLSTQNEIYNDLVNRKYIYSASIIQKYNYIIVTVDKSIYEESIIKYKSLYGDMVQVEIGEPIKTLKNNSVLVIGSIILACICIIILLILFLKKIIKI